MRGRGRKLVAIQTEARCLKSNTWSTSRSQGDCSRPSSCHVAAGREHDRKPCQTRSYICNEMSHAFRLGRLRHSVADALTAWQTDRLCCWHACVSVWISTSFRLLPHIHKHANAWWSLQLHTICAIHTDSHRPALDSCAATVRPVYVQAPEGRLVQLGRLWILDFGVVCFVVT
jgi:hypothetical protein